MTMNVIDLFVALGLVALFFPAFFLWWATR